MEIYRILAVVGILLLFGVLSSKLSSRFNVPILLMFLGVGMMCGSDGFGLVDVNSATDSGPINFLGTVAMCFILFSGGLDTNFNSIRKVLTYGTILATVGVLLTALIVGFSAWYFLKLDLTWCLLLGSIISSTDAAAVFAILRSKGVSLKGNLRPLLELESGSNDPMAAFLTLFMLGLITGQGQSAIWFLPQLAAKMGIGIAAGWIFGKVGAWLFNKMKLEYEGLYVVTGVAIVILSYGIAETAYGNGFMSVYVCGLTMGNLRYNYKKGLLRFSDGIAWLMQVALFTALGLLVNPHELLAPEVWGTGLLLSAILMLVARPVAVFLCTPGKALSTRERALISWVGLRGAAPIVLATFPLVANINNSNTMFNMVFFIVLTSVILQGRTLMPAAKLLKLDKPITEKARIPLELEQTDAMNSDMHEFEVANDNPAVGKTLAELKLPPTVLVMLIRRENRFILARGNTLIEAGDGMLMMGDGGNLRKVAETWFPDEEVIS